MIQVMPRRSGVARSLLHPPLRNPQSARAAEPCGTMRVDSITEAKYHRPSSDLKMLVPISGASSQTAAPSFVATADAKRPVVVLNMAYTGLGIARNLHSFGIPVIAVVHNYSYACRTRAAKVIQGPDAATDPEDALTFLCDLAEHLLIKPILLATRDLDVLFIEHHRDRLERHYLLPMPAPGVVLRLMDKFESAQMASRAGLPVPATFRASSASEIENIAREVSYPCVVKPTMAADWRGTQEWQSVGKRKAFSVKTREELLREYDKVSQASPHVVVQELIPGPDTNLCVFGGYFNRESRMVAGLYARKILQWPPGFGTGFLLQSTEPSIAGEYASRFMRSSCYHGVAELEFKLDPRDGEFKFIEVNTRHWDWHALATRCGINLTKILYDDVGGTAELVPATRSGEASVKWIEEDALLYYGFEMVRSHALGARQLWQGLRGKRAYAYFSLTDPLPFISFLGSACATALRKSIRALSGK